MADLNTQARRRIIITSGQSNLTTGRMAVARGRSNGDRHVEAVCTPPNTIQLHYNYNTITIFLPYTANTILVTPAQITVLEKVVLL